MEEKKLDVCAETSRVSFLNEANDKNCTCSYVSARTSGKRYKLLSVLIEANDVHVPWPTDGKRAYPNSAYSHRYCTNQCHNFICCHWRCQRSNSNKTYISNVCLFVYCGVQHILCCDFALFFFVLCTLCCQFLWIVLFWLSFGIIIFHVNFLSSHWLRSVCQFNLSHGRGW